MRENRPYGSEGGVGESRSRPLSIRVEGHGTADPLLPSSRNLISPLIPTFSPQAGRRSALSAWLMHVVQALRCSWTSSG
jgi:hypothetical protein